MGGQPPNGEGMRIANARATQSFKTTIFDASSRDAVLPCSESKAAGFIAVSHSLSGLQNTRISCGRAPSLAIARPSASCACWTARPTQDTTLVTELEPIESDVVDGIGVPSQVRAGRKKRPEPHSCRHAVALWLRPLGNLTARIVPDALRSNCTSTSPLFGGRASRHFSPIEGCPGMRNGEVRIAAQASPPQAP